MYKKGACHQSVEMFPSNELLLCKVLCIHEFPRAALTKYYELGGLKNNQNLFALSSGGQKSEIPSKLVGKNPSFFYILVVTDNSWCSLVCKCITPISASVFTWPPSLSVWTVSKFLSSDRAPVILDIESTLIQYDLILTWLHL